MPRPGGGDDFIDAGKLYGPAQLAHGLAGVGIERGRIARPPWSSRVGDFATRNLFHRLNHLEYRGRPAGAQIVEQGGTRFIQLWKNGNVCATKVVDVDIVPQAGTIRSRVVGAKYLQCWAATRCGIDRKRDKMRFWIVRFTDGSVFRGPGRVEVTERRKAESTRLRERLEGIFHIQLGLTVGVDRSLR